MVVMAEKLKHTVEEQEVHTVGGFGFQDRFG